MVLIHTDAIDDFLNKIGKGRQGFMLSDKGNALYNYKLSIRYGDKEAAAHYITKYATPIKEGGLGGTGAPCRVV